MVGAPLFLRLTLGPVYAHHGTRVLQLLALALPFTAINALYVTYARLARRMRRVAVTQICITTVILAESFFLVGSLGITGVGVGFLVGQATVAIVVAPSVIRQYRRPDMEPGFAPGATLVAQGGPEIGQLLDGGLPLSPNLPQGPKAPGPRGDDARVGSSAWYAPPWAPEWHRAGSSTPHAIDDALREH